MKRGKQVMTNDRPWEKATCRFVGRISYRNSICKARCIVLIALVASFTAAAFEDMCFDEDGSLCADNPDYRSPRLHLSCANHAMLLGKTTEENCFQKRKGSGWVLREYSDEEMINLASECPCVCNICSRKIQDLLILHGSLAVDNDNSDEDEDEGNVEPATAETAVKISQEQAAGEADVAENKGEAELEHNESTPEIRHSLDTNQPSGNKVKEHKPLFVPEEHHLSSSSNELNTHASGTSEKKTTDFELIAPIRTSVSRSSVPEDETPSQSPFTFLLSLFESHGLVAIIAGAAIFGTVLFVSIISVFQQSKRRHKKDKYLPELPVCMAGNPSLSTRISITKQNSDKLHRLGVLQVAGEGNQRESYTDETCSSLSTSSSQGRFWW